MLVWCCADDRRRGGWPFQALAFVEGVPGTQADATFVWRVLGDYPRRFHAVALDGFGETLDDFLTDDGPLAARGVYPAAARDALLPALDDLTLRASTAARSAPTRSPPAPGGVAPASP